MGNSSLPNDPSITPPAQTQGVTEIRQRTIAALIARGFSVKYVAKKLKISESRIYHLLSDKNSLVNAEINSILKDLFAGNDRRLVNLYDKVLEKLDAMLSSSDKEKQSRAIDRIIKIYLTRSAKNAVTIQQYFGIQTQEEKEGHRETMDEIILRMRKERGLPEIPDDYLQDIISQMRKARGLPELPDHDMQDIISKVQGSPELPDHGDSSHPAPNHSSNSSPNNLLQGAPSQGAPSQGASSQDAPSQDAPSQEYEEFLKQLT
jgi:AcrR family transcriptional regulator